MRIHPACTSIFLCVTCTLPAERCQVLALKDNQSVELQRCLPSKFARPAKGCGRAADLTGIWTDAGGSAAAAAAAGGAAAAAAAAGEHLGTLPSMQALCCPMLSPSGSSGIFSKYLTKLRSHLAEGN